MTLKKSYWAIGGSALVAVGLWTLSVYGQSGPGFHRRGGAIGERPGMMFLRGANLTADQRSQVQQIIASHRPTFQELFGRLRAAQQELSNRLFSTGGLQEADLAPQVRQISLLRNQIAEENLRVALEIRSVLTPDQLAKAAQLRERMQTLRDEMRNLMMQKESE